MGSQSSSRATAWRISACPVKFVQLRGRCDNCDRTSVAEVAGRLMEEIPCEAVGRILFLNSKTMWSLDQCRMEIMMQYLRMREDLDVSYLAADEVHFRIIEVKNRVGLFAKRWRPEFVTNLVAPKAGKVLFNAIGRDSKTLAGALAILSPEQKKNVRML